MKNIDAVLHTRGEAEYVDDIPQPADMLYAAILGSPVAHGKVNQLKLSTAKKDLWFLCIQLTISSKKTLCFT